MKSINPLKGRKSIEIPVFLLRVVSFQIFEQTFNRFKRI
ncbi:hypothetical protein G436_1824 [Leptospira interrogans serovar Hardjo str. Norma]|uniref:Uncharacterized protein n=1 Tax=Leptospira interrogans serovar Hardjo str. Norma TaxID=1279460 RepID=A0A0M4N848_LEPIR|nr:hypothetical protein G436_1824 [Leptospira interrogans serovar Hardjo str. Norma]EKO95797.1 hypothetical protein LEP1GSC057_1282 [Leptospira interrogans str. Brem 329]